MLNVKLFTDFRKRICENCGKIIVGKDEVIEEIIICLIAGGHVLLEDLPGTGKTMLLRAFSKSIGGTFRRIQFTPDLLPSDMTGINFYDQKQGEFIFRKGPLFANVVLADEINRAVPRSQSALLEVMEEHQVSVDGVTYPVSRPYIVMATQNPIESHGTFPLPEAQLDRFFMKLSLGYMEREEEISVLRRPDTADLLSELQPAVKPEELETLQKTYAEVQASKDIDAYLMDIIEYTRKSPVLSSGASVRASLALYKAAKIRAAISGRDFVIPEDIKQEAVPVLSHRILMAQGSHLMPDQFVRNMLEDISVPLEKV